jgi:uncharacterized membrane protein
MSALFGFTERDLLLILAYCWLLALVPLFLRREDRDLQWHARNGLGLFIAETLLMIPLGLVAVPFLLVFKGAGLLFVFILSFLLWLFLLALHLSGMRRALRGERLAVPVVSGWAERI